MLSPLQTPPLRQLRRSSPIPARCAQHVVIGGFFGDLLGPFRGNNQDFSEDGAGQTTRAVLVYARGRLSRARTEKATVGFRADKSPKKPPFFCFSPLLNPDLLPLNPDLS